MPRKYTDEFFKNGIEQAKIKAELTAAIPAGVTYFNLVITLAELLKDFSALAFKDEVMHYNATHEGEG